MVSTVAFVAAGLLAPFFVAAGLLAPLPAEALPRVGEAVAGITVTFRRLEHLWQAVRHT